MNKKMITLAIFAATGLSLAHAGEPTMRIGPYFLGMSNAQASKAGISGCKDVTSGTIRCEGSVQALGIGRPIKIDFDARTKQIEAMEVVVGIANRGQEAFADLARDLQLGACPANRTEDGGWTCFSRPYNVRAVHYNNGSSAKRWQSNGPFFLVMARTKAHVARVFFDAKPRERRKQDKLKDFSQGK
ncbi:MAG: hypothetical protein V4684_04705 [Pseudomonadota bacterium]